VKLHISLASFGLRRFLAGLAALLGLALSSTALFSAPAYIGPNPDRKIDETKVTYFVSPTGQDANDGRTRATAFGTLQKAADVVEPGETVLVTKGRYHQSMHIKKEGRADAWITFVAEPGAEIRGSQVWTNWKAVAGQPGIYAAPRPALHRAYQKPDADLKQRTEQVFVNGRLLRQVPDPAMLKPKGTFYVDDNAAQLLVCLEGGRDPNNDTTEVTTLTYAIAIAGIPNQNTIPNLKTVQENKAAYIRIDGFTIRHIGNFSRMAAIQARGAWQHLIIENCDIQWVNYTGIALNGVHNFDRQKNEWFEARAHHAIIRNNIISHCGAQAVGGGGVDDQLFECNIMDGNNYKGISPWSEGGAIKTGFGGSRIHIRWNVARNNHNHGLWYDYGATDCTIENNFVYRAVAGAILNEVTPTPGEERTADGRREEILFTAEQARNIKQRGTVIRNNILIGTRTPGGGGINISSSCDTEVFNNITAGNEGGGINFGGSPTRPHTQGLFRNNVHRNISFRDFHAATTLRDSDDKSRRFFDNVAWDNLYVQWQAKTPFKISGVDSNPEEWQSYNQGRKNYYSDKNIFRDPDHFDFTFTAEGLALIEQTGFDPKALRLDWSEYFVPEESKAVQRETMDFTPIDLSGIFNRALVDEAPGDGQGGWTDQGGDDLSGFPTGRQIIDGVEYLLGMKEKGAILLANTQVKGATFPKAVTVPIGGRFDQLRFLYASAWTPTEGEIARFIIHYADGSTVNAPIIAGRHILDWRIDPTWQQHAALNDHRVYAAWYGPNRSAAKVLTYHYWWQNPEPEKAIANVTLENQAAEKTCFFLLGVTGATRKQAGNNPLVFHISFDGDVDALDSTGGYIEAQGFNQAAFDAGKFVDGVKGKGFIPGKPMHYAFPEEFALAGQGTMSVWLKAEDWRTPERKSLFQRADYTRTMTPVSTHGGRGWSFSFEVSKQDHSSLRLNTSVSSMGVGVDVTPLVRPGEWFNLLVRWHPHPEKSGQTRLQLFFNGQLIETKDQTGAPSLPAEQFFIGVPRNGGQPWRGVMDEFAVWNVAFDDAAIREYLAGMRQK
jgi:hypothetical protein